MFYEETAAALGLKKEAMGKYIEERTGFTLTV